MLKPAIPNIFAKDFAASLAYYTGPLGFDSLFVSASTILATAVFPSACARSLTW